MKNYRYLYVVAAAAAAGAVFGAIFSTKLKPPPLEEVVQPLWVSMALYGLFSMYWTFAARNSAPVKSAEHWASTALHQLLLNVSLLLLFFRIPGLTGRWLPVLAIWARRHLGRNWSAAVTAMVDHQLIRTGPYRRLRHPIYTAMFGMHIGIAVASGEWHALAGVALLAIAYSRKIGLEERTLRRVFGEEHDAYRQQSWALIPWVL
jgi:isoprenylcysteine carboxyl methyltransferase (ICMT) family protein YpbQ